jgi:hypothetical protein
VSVVSFGAIANKLAGRRKSKGDAGNPTDPVRAYSWDVNDDRGRPGRPIGDGSPQQGWAFKNALVETFRQLCTKHKVERYDGPHKVQDTFLRSFERALAFLDYKTGDFFFSYQRLAEETGQSRSNVIQMVECAEHWGLLCHVRRSEKVDGALGQAGPQRKQAANAYYFDCERRMPKDLWAVLWRKLVANLKRLQGAATRAAAFLKRAFNGVAQPAPRAAGKELAHQLSLMSDGLDRRDAAAASASP